MSPGSIWIERDQNGNSIFVREKIQRPSTFDVLASVLTLAKRHSLSLCRDRVVSVPVGAPLALPPPSPRSYTTATKMAQPPNSETAIALASHDGHEHMLNYPPGMQYVVPYPYPMWDSGHYHYPPPAGYTVDPVPMPIAVPTAVPIATSNERKYKCSICGKYRSPQYHYRHPLPPGQTPPSTICKKCQRSKTPSTDDSGSSLRRTRTRRSYYSSDGSRVVEETITESEGERRLHRSPSRVRLIRRSRSRSGDSLYIRTRREYPRSSETSFVGSIVGSFRRRPRSPSVERIIRRVYYSDDDAFASDHSTGRRTYVADRSRRRVRESSGYDSYYDSDDYGYHSSST